jgi:hypothetical protein
VAEAAPSAASFGAAADPVSGPASNSAAALPRALPCPPIAAAEFAAEPDAAAAGVASTVVLAITAATGWPEIPACDWLAAVAAVPSSSDASSFLGLPPTAFAAVLPCGDGADVVGPLPAPFVAAAVVAVPAGWAAWPLALLPFVPAPFALVPLGRVPAPFAVPAFVVAGALALLVAEPAPGAVAGDGEFPPAFQPGPLASLCWLVCEAGAGGGGAVADAVASSKAANGCDVVCWVAAGCDHCGGV